MIPLGNKRKADPKDPKTLMKALDGSPERSGAEQKFFYQTHASPKYKISNDYMNVMADAWEEGKIKAVGVANFSKDQISEEHETLVQRSVFLATVMDDGTI